MCSEKIGIPSAVCALSLVVLAAIIAKSRFLLHQTHHVKSTERHFDTTADANISTKRKGCRSYIIYKTIELVLLFSYLGVSNLAFILQESDATVRMIHVVLSIYFVLLSLCHSCGAHTGRHDELYLCRFSRVGYCSLAICSTVLLRSAIVDGTSRTRTILEAGRFLIFGFLSIISLSVSERVQNARWRTDRSQQCQNSWPESTCSLLSSLTFSWIDPLLWQGSTRTLRLEDLWDLMLQDRSAHVVNDFRSQPKVTSLAWRLIRTSWSHVSLQMSWAFLSSILSFGPPLLLRSLLKYLEAPNDHREANAWTCVTALALCCVLSAIANGQSLWLGRKLSVRIRAILIAGWDVFYQLRLALLILDRNLCKIAPTQCHRVRREIEQETEIHHPVDRPGKSRTRRCISTISGHNRSKSQSAPQKSNSQSSPGTTTNLMAIDSFQVGELGSYIQDVFPTLPTQLVIATILLWSFMGISALVSVGCLMLLLPLNVIFATLFTRSYHKIMKQTDARIGLTSEFLQSIKIIKYLAWETKFSFAISEKRGFELKALRFRYLVLMLSLCIWRALPLVVIAISFLTYTTIEKRPLVPSTAFPALGLFGLLRTPFQRLADLTVQFQQSRAALARIDQFLREKETQKYGNIVNDASISQSTLPYVGFKSAKLCWGASALNENGGVSEFCLSNMNARFHENRLNTIIGPTGSGKTSLLMGLLGELKLLSGSIGFVGSSLGNSRQPESSFHSIESVAFCAHVPWLLNDTVKENILLGQPFQEGRYYSVVEACALDQDFDTMDHGDKTLVGEQGIVLSGGQKQRICLARALYNTSKYLLLDDSLSAVDSKTAAYILGNLCGLHGQGRTIICATNNASLYAPVSSYMVALENGKCINSGTPKQLVDSHCLQESVLLPANSTTGTDISTRLSPASFTPDDEGSTVVEVENHDNPEDPRSLSVPKIANLAEKIEEGRIKWSTLKFYITMMGPWYYWVVMVVGFSADSICSILANNWLRVWSNAYAARKTPDETREKVSHALFRGLWLQNEISNTFDSHYPSHRGSLLNRPEPKVNDYYYVGIYLLFCLAFFIVGFTSCSIMFSGSLRASRQIHDKILSSVSKGRFQYFDETPLGQLMNRFSKDLQVVDQNLAAGSGSILSRIVGIVSQIILISIFVPLFLFPGIILTILYALTGILYLNTARSLKRLEAAQRSPLHQHFGETIRGTVTIRAYGEESRFIQTNYKSIDEHSRAFLALWATTRWLAFRFDVAGGVVTFCAGALILLNRSKLDPGAAGLSLTYVLTFNDTIRWLVQLYSENEQNMAHVERLMALLNIDPEIPATKPSFKPTSSWPQLGTVQFYNYTTRYRPELNPALANLNFSIASKERIGVVGRTGAGKSSLAMAMIRGLRADTGSIFIDGVDISRISLRDLRDGLTIVPQDPTVFSGTIRSNLDPFEMYTDAEVIGALRQVRLIPSRTEHYKSQTPMLSIRTSSESGMSTLSTSEEWSTLNQVSTTPSPDTDLEVPSSSTIGLHSSATSLSQGQRQLLCLARAILKSPRLLIMDEATASMDHETDTKIQVALRQLFDTTIITIAHRLQTVIDYDRILVLDHGKSVEFDRPIDLLRKGPGGPFWELCMRSGTLPQCMEAAEKAEKDRVGMVAVG